MPYFNLFDYSAILCSCQAHIFFLYYFAYEEIKMAEAQKKIQKKRADIRFEREAKALQKNLEKRKKQQKARDALKQKS